MEHLSVVPCYDKLAAILQAMSAPVQLSLMGCPRYEVVVLLYTMQSVYGTRSVTEGPSASASAVHSSIAAAQPQLYYRMYLTTYRVWGIT